MRLSVFAIVAGLSGLLLVAAACDDGATEPSANKPPRCTVTSPDNYSIFDFGDTIRFAGMAADPEDVTVPADALVWESSIDGLLGGGSEIERRDLSAADHLVRFIATDSAGARDTAGVWVRVQAPAAPDTTVHILFLGGDLFIANGLVGLVRDLAEAAGRDVWIAATVVDSFFLDEHAAAPETIERIESAPWDFVVLQGRCPNAAYPGQDDLFPPYESHPLLPALASLEQTITAHCDSTRILYCLPWAWENGTAGVTGLTDDYFEMQQKAHDNTRSYAAEAGVAVAPVGWAWREVMLTDPRPHYLHQTDAVSPALRGSYLAACTIYSALFGASAEGLPTTGALPNEEVELLRAVAAEVVLDDPARWYLDFPE